MKLVLRAPDETTLQLDLEDFATPLSRQLTLTATHLRSLQHLCASYQAAINQPRNTDVLYTIGYQLFELLNQHPDIVGQWLDNVGRRQLEIRTALAPNPPNLLQRLLLNLPWEVMAWNKQFLAADTVLYEVVRRVGEANLATPPARYKDMTLVFMAADPDFNSGLNYENEERAILQATRRARNLNLWVEESGNLDSLTQRITESGHCDMVHISCHGGYDEKLKSFVLQLEDDRYHPQAVTASAFRGLAQRIQCLFLSACHSAELKDAPAFAMELAKTGIANVIGWDGSVSDEDATVFAAEVYHALLQQATVPFACAAARQQLLQEHQRTGKHPHWHLGRVYLAPNGGWPLIDSSNPPSPKRRGKSFHELLDRKKNVVPVASKETFVGRRRQTKQALRAFTEKPVKGVLLTGMGGSGKSSLAARVVHRMEPQYKAAIIYKDYSEAAILGELKQFVPGDSRNGDFQRYLTDIQQHPDLFADNLVDILEKHLSENPIILVVDDLEQHALEALKTASVMDGKVGVKRAYQNALRGVIDAFVRADTASRLILTSRHRFCLPDWRGQDVAEELLEIKVSDMNPVEQEKHWLALLQSGVVTGARDEVRDRAFLEQIWGICQGNPGLQDVLYQPLLKGEYTVLQTALRQLQAYHAGQLAAPATAMGEVDKYLQRIALEAYHAALTDTERQCLRVLSLFDFAVPEQLIIQAGSQLGIEDAQTALQRLDNFGLLTHWQGEGLEGHISCYGLARKIVAPLSKEDRHYIASVCVPLLWHIWFAELLLHSMVGSTELKMAIEHCPLLPPEKSQELMQLELQGLQQIYPLQLEKHHALPLQQNGFQRISQLHEFCIMNSRYDWQALGVDPEHFIDLLELSISLAYFDKLAISYAMLMQLTDDQVKELNRILETERSHFKAIQENQVSDFIRIVLDTFSGTHLLTRAYQLYVANADQEQLRTLSGIQLSNEEDRLVAAINLAGNTGKAYAYGNYAYFLYQQKQDYAQAELLYQRAVEADPKHANNLGAYANFLADQKQDYVQAEVMYQRAVEADPHHANNLGNYANFLADQKQDYAQAELMYQRAVEADPKDANNLGNYAVFLKNQKRDYAQAEVMYQRAVEADPHHVNHLGNYAYFLYQQKQDYAQAELMYQRAVEADPHHANHLGNYAKLLFVTNQKANALQCLEKSESQPNLKPDLQVELAFYRYAHCRPYALAPLKQQLQSGSRSIGWDLTDNVKRACADKHPQPKLLTAIAQVISGEQDIATLDPYPEWTEIP